MNSPTIKDVILLFESEKNNFLGVSHKHIAKKLKSNETETLELLTEMAELNILERLSGAEFILNPKDMWKK
ncbi:MAG: hypothetical protein PHW96_02750 [Candidatus Nanoarchaeia archaeon]|nr:hypothetical protein [Candidatus Nanoarchaeia archaeon]